MNPGVGIVLSGGGAKGAYQIGALKALSEFNVIDNLSAISGTSVGALNSILYLNGHKKAQQIWDSISSSDVLTFEPVDKLFSSLRNSVTLYSPLANLGKIKTSIWLYILSLSLVDGVFTREGLSRVIDKLPLDKVLNSGITISISLCTLNSLIPKCHVIQVDLSNKHTASELKDLILASSAIPFIFPPHRYRNQFYYDGGLIDFFPFLSGGQNFPVDSLVNNPNVDFIIGIGLDSDLKTQEKHRQKCDIYISPGNEYFSGLDQMLDFDKVKYRQMLKIGYLNAAKELLKFQREHMQKQFDKQFQLKKEKLDALCRQISIAFKKASVKNQLNQIAKEFNVQNIEWLDVDNIDAFLSNNNASLF